MKLEWNVFRHNTGTQRIDIFNIFDHDGFNEDIMKLLIMPGSKRYFAENLQRILHYYFACKTEHEITIGPWAGGVKSKNGKVDIYTQVIINMDVFVNYLWLMRGKPIANMLDGDEMMPEATTDLDGLAAPNNYVALPSEEDIAYAIHFRQTCRRYNINFVNADEDERDFVMRMAEKTFYLQP